MFLIKSQVNGRNWSDVFDQLYAFFENEKHQRGIYYTGD